MLLIPTLHCGGRCAEVIELYKNTICFPADSSDNKYVDSEILSSSLSNM